MRRALMCFTLALGFVAAGVAAPRDRATAFRALHSLEGARVFRVDDRAEVRVYESDIELPATFVAALEAALTELAAVLGPAGEPIRFEVGGMAKSMAVAYNPREDVVVFPRNNKVKNHGLEDYDRLRHELFHAYVGRTHPHLVTPEALKSHAVRAVHEGAADFFAALGDDNGTFGDRFADDQGPLRSYRTPMCFSLVQGSHAQGNTLTSYWLDQRWGLEELAARLDAGCEEVACMVAEEDQSEFGLDPTTRPEVRPLVEGLTPSKIHRYRVQTGAVLAFEGSEGLAARYPRLETQFTTRSGTEVPGWRFVPLETKVRRRSFRIEPGPEATPQKIIVRHLALGEVVGFDVIYLSRAK